MRLLLPSLNHHVCANCRLVGPVRRHRRSASACSHPQVSFAHGRLAVGLGSAVDHDNELMMAADMPEIKGAAHHKLHVGFAARDHPVDIVLRTAKHE